MTTALDLPAEKLDEVETRFVEAIQKFGWFCTRVAGDEAGPAFSYTSGIWEKAKHSELIMFGLPKDTSYGVFEGIYRDLDRGIIVETGVPLSNVFGSAVAYAFPVAEKHCAEYLGWSRWFYRGNAFPCIQIVWPDRTGKFPWEADFDPAFCDDQPDLSELGWRKLIK